MTEAARMTVGVATGLCFLTLPTAFSAPTFLSPLPLLVLIPIFAIGFPGLLVPGFLFAAWSPQLFRGEGVVPRRSVVLLGVLTLLTVPYFVVSWEYGVEYQGLRHTVAVAVANAFVLAGAWVLLYRARRGATFMRSLVLHAVIFGWLAWCAFPSLGELP